jgi:hypothetical protein
MKELLILNKKERERLIIMNQIESKVIDAAESAILLKVRERQVCVSY